MGSCMNGDKQRGIRPNFIEDKVLLQRTQIYTPIYSTLYAIFRKPAEVQIIHNRPPSNKHFSVDSIRKMDPKQLKTLFSFKKIFIVGVFQSLRQIVSKINTNCSATGIYVLEQKQFKKFEQQYPIFKDNSNRLKTSQIPLLAFDSEELISPPSGRTSLFIHLSQNRNSAVYSQLNIKKQNIISQPDTALDKQKMLSYYGTRLKNIQVGKVLLLHNKNFHQNDLLQLISIWLIQRYQISQFSTKKYLARTLPKASIISNKSELLIALDQNKTKKNNQQGVKSSLELYEQLFNKHKDQNGAQKTQRAYNLLIKLISNIYSNQNNQNYRKVKAANKQMQQLLTRSKYGKRLLEQVGFKQKQGFWVNILQDKYLKVIRTDLDLAYKNCFK